MPRQPRIKKPMSASQAVVPTTALTASAHRYQGNTPRIYAPSAEWQKRCYHHYSQCGEARFAARYFGHALSRAVLGVSTREGEPITTGPEADALNELFSGPEGQGQMLELCGVHLMVAGECYLVGREIDGVDVWETLASTEVQSSAGNWQIKAPDSNAWIDLAKEDVVIRVWLPKPDSRWEADSPFRSMLPVLDEIEWITRYIHAQTTSRLAGAGLLVLPDSITFPPPPPIDGKEQAAVGEAEGFMLTLGESMMQPIMDPSSAAAKVPLVVTAPSDAIGDIKHLTFWTDLDENARQMRQDAIHRFALGMDLPPEMILGMGSNSGTGGGRSNGVSHWGAWQIEEQTIKLHVEPMLDVLCAAITSSYLRPLIEDSTSRVTFDTSALRLRPDRSVESITLADRGWLKVEVALAENGFSPEDMPSAEERRDWLLMKVASGSATPEQVGAALQVLGVDLPVTETPAEDVTRESRPAPSMEDVETRPRTPEYAACEALVLRALERAGNRLRNLHQLKTQGPAYEAHTHIQANGTAVDCLEDAWSTADIVLGSQSSTLVPLLNNYCLSLIRDGQSHSRDRMVHWLSGEPT